MMKKQHSVRFLTTLRGQEVEVYMWIMELHPNIRFGIELSGDGAPSHSQLTRREVSMLCREAARRARLL